jgi:hypothetical protein
MFKDPKSVILAATQLAHIGDCRMSYSTKQTLLESAQRLTARPPSLPDPHFSVGFNTRSRTAATRLMTRRRRTPT